MRLDLLHCVNRRLRDMSHVSSEVSLMSFDLDVAELRWAGANNLYSPNWSWCCMSMCVCVCFIQTRWPCIFWRRTYAVCTVCILRQESSPWRNKPFRRFPGVGIFCHIDSRHDVITKMPICWCSHLQELTIYRKGCGTLLIDMEPGLQRVSDV